MKVSFSPKAYKDFYAWSLRDKKLYQKINDLILDTIRDPFKGLGKPEPLKHQYKGF